MAVNAYLVLVDRDGKLVTGESTVNPDFADPFANRPAVKGVVGGVFEITDYAFDIEQTLTIGAQSTGAGAGKVSFNPFSVTRRTDRLTPLLHQMCCSGTTFRTVDLLLRRTGGTGAGSVWAAFGFSLVAVRTMAWSTGDDGVVETVRFAYGGLSVGYQKPDQQNWDVRGWDVVKNVATTT